MSENAAEKKWNKIYTSQASFDTQVNSKAASVLQEHLFLLPDSGEALDLACGRGANAQLLAKCGLHAHAWDISKVVIEELQTLSKQNNLNIAAEVRDVEEQPPKPASFDVICISYYLERTLCNSIIQALKPNGLLFYQTFLKEKISDSGPSNPQYRLNENELLELFSSLHILAYQEYGTVGAVKRGLRDEATLVAQKR